MQAMQTLTYVCKLAWHAQVQSGGMCTHEEECHPCEQGGKAVVYGAEREVGLVSEENVRCCCGGAGVSASAERFGSSVGIFKRLRFDGGCCDRKCCDGGC
jgi:hypothetical protein